MPFQTPSDHLPYAHQTPQTMGVYSPSNDASSAEPAHSMMRQSSMPHSYSMAFDNRERLLDTEDSIDGVVPTATGDAKRLNEWFLVEEFVGAGVKPTTHYRKDAARKPNHGEVVDRPCEYAQRQRRRRMHHPENRKLSGRAMSGRKGGYASSQGHRRRRAEEQTQQHHAHVVESSPAYALAPPPWAEMGAAPEMLGALELAMKPDLREPLTPDSGQLSYAMLPSSHPAMVVECAPVLTPYYTPPFIHGSGFDITDVSGVYTGGNVFANFGVRAFQAITDDEGCDRRQFSAAGI
ncbi:unnamed protein product [Parascedosporium putredinis]|uniref:Uncharacterized protein n=1 Tax=Parascedosporium putredinis TaxID=1442378 RepID=A0A9P1MEM6_9PEZI|nr:unnamed protein product [Parascedosporium putredinis]CAI8001832.1 unnamed protein product [Parascedosporium putredinis]